MEVEWVVGVGVLFVFEGAFRRDGEVYRFFFWEGLLSSFEGIELEIF